MKRVLILGILLGASGLTGLYGADWPMWRGANRDGISRDTGLMRQWPEEGPPLVWRNNTVGNTMNGLAVMGSAVYTVGSKGGMECVFCINNETGKTLWARPIGKGYSRSFYPIQRSTPTIYKNLIYVLSSAGNLVCMNSGDGMTRWYRNVMTTMGGVLPPGGYAESPYVDGKWVIVCPGGPNASMVAIDRHFGQNVWVAKSGMAAGYSSIIKASFGREHQYVSFSAEGLFGAKVRGGDVRWRYEAPANAAGVSATPPLWFGQTMLASSSTGTGVVWLQKEGQAYKAQEVWFNKDLAVPTGDLLKINDYVFACTEKDGLVCFSYRDGKILWSDKSLFPGDEEEESATPKKSKKRQSASSDPPASVVTGPTYLAFAEEDSEDTRQFTIPKAAKSKKAKKRVAPPKPPRYMATMTYAEGFLYIRTSAGELALVEANPNGFHLRGKIALPQMKRGLGVTPVIANGHLYLREGSTIFCFDIRDKSRQEESSESSQETQETPSEKRSLPGMPTGPEVRQRGVPRVG
ncbi:MAG: PQQ-binding-like beta-propeller repeat protein [Planctomycetia bacterium]|nr:PQQ-binding-like beta-propeller repeat protein [Planctomycetia bacterium]